MRSCDFLRYPGSPASVIPTVRSAATRTIAAYVFKMVRRLNELEREKRGEAGRSNVSVAATLADLATSLREMQAEEASRADEATPSSQAQSLPSAMNPQAETQDWLANLEWLAPLADVTVSSELDPYGNLFSSEMMDYNALMSYGQRTEGDGVRS